MVGTMLPVGPPVPLRIVRRKIRDGSNASKSCQSGQNSSGTQNFLEPRDKMCCITGCKLFDDGWGSYIFSSPYRLVSCFPAEIWQRIGWSSDKTIKRTDCCHPYKDLP